MNNPALYELKCPHPDCGGPLHVRSYDTAGEYKCICACCVIKLSWATYQQAGRKGRSSRRQANECAMG